MDRKACSLQFGQHDPWTLILQNNGATDDRLMSIESPSVAKVELHRSVVTNDIANMQPMEDGLVIPAGAIVWLGDCGTHAMFTKPDRRHVEGDEIEAILVFEKAGRIEVTFKVEKRTATEMGPGHRGMDMSGGTGNGN
ncbi:MAG: copper chaperone PCu(A)C [Devosia marina]|uniref:copper chaperone PCu(A)C n=1 Tax=Devosia marina TaxID=2683198 RepID=UPI0032EEBF5B